MLKEENVSFEDSVERLVLEELTNTENGYGYDFNDDVEQMKIIAKVRYVDFQKRSHTVEVESDSADRKHLEDLVKARYPADKVYFQSVRQK